MTPNPQPQQEYIVTEEQLTDMVENGTVGYSPYRAEVAKIIRSRPAPSPQPTPETCKKYWNYRADSGYLYHLLYDLLGVMPTEDTLGDALMEVREHDTTIRNRTLDELQVFVEKRHENWPFSFDTDREPYEKVIQKIQSIRSTPTQEHP